MHFCSLPIFGLLSLLLPLTKALAPLATGPGNSIEEVGRDGESQVIIAGIVNSTEIAEPTSAQFGRTAADREVLYVTTGGGLAAPVDGDEIVGGQLVAVDTDGLWRA